MRRTPGTDRVLREVDRSAAPRAGLDVPDLGYDDLTAAQVVARSASSPAELRRVGDYERKNANRKSVLAAVEKKLR